MDGRRHPQRGGRAKRVVRVTPKGALAAKAFYDAIMRVSRGTTWAVGQTEGARESGGLGSGAVCRAIAGCLTNVRPSWVTWRKSANLVAWVD